MHRVGCRTRFVLALWAGFAGWAVSAGTAAEKATAGPLPETIGAWRMAAPPVRVLPEGIFEYMDGAGELYLGYRFEHLDVAEYEAPGEPRILAEVYRLGSPDDAFGLLSTDWGGDRVELTGPSPPAWPPHALYGAGLLRLASGSVYARIMADRETDSSRRAVLDLGRAVAAGGGGAAVPAIVGSLPTALPGGLTLLRERSVFFRSHLVLNSIYFVSHADILTLSPTVEAVASRYERQAGSAALVVLIRYTNPDGAAAAFRSFVAAYLHEAAPTGRDETPGGPQAARVEDGWVGCARSAETLIVAFQCADEGEARNIVIRMAASLAAREAGDE